jgi:hypothetical protein
VLMILAGTISFAGFATSPIYEICAFAFGVGIGLTIDEFALWLYLDDVYWSERGRSSVDAAVLAASFLGLVLIGVRPFDVSGDDVGAVIGSVITVAITLGTVLICFAKERLWHGAIGFFVGPLAIYGACRIGKPESPWAKRYYGERNPAKQAKAEERFKPGRRTDRVKDWLRDAIGGSTETEYLEKIERRG